MRAWLNNTFLRAAFTSDEQKGIITTLVSNPDNPRFGTDAGRDTQDKVFLLSIWEAETFFSSKSARRAQNTAYTLAHGADWSGSYSYWWLRSPGDCTESAVIINTDGYICDDGVGTLSGCFTVRPAVSINLDLLTNNNGVLGSISSGSADDSMPGNQAGDSSPFLALVIPPTQFDKANSSWTGSGPFVEGDRKVAGQGASFLHVYGIGSGRITYLFNISDSSVAGRTTNVKVSARLSSNYPWFTAPADGYSDVTLYFNGDEISTLRVMPDNGAGKIYTWNFGPELILYGKNALSFVVKSGAAYKNGLCIYYDSLTSSLDDCAIVLKIDVP